jgi:catechol 2,3-dioxygenase-like lactoylglutathione lyase family enzyme
MNTVVRTPREAPPLTRVHHLSLTVSDLASSVEWYCRVLGLERVMEEHHEGGMAIVLTRPGTSLFLGLHRHDRNDGSPGDETITGLDHVAFHVAERQDVDAWIQRLDGFGIAHGELYETNDPFPYALVAFRDPDNIQLEVIWA